MKPIKNYEEFVNESMNEAMSFDEIKDKYLDNPYGIGADAIEFIDSERGNSRKLIFRHGDKLSRNQIEKNLKTLGIPAKKMSKSMLDKAYKYRFELHLYESINEESMNEGSTDEMVKRSCVERLSQFFRVSPNALSHFKFDGTDNIKALTKALNSTSDEGTEAYYKVAIKVGKQDAGIEESAKCPPIYIPKLDNIDHTRIIKWMDNQFDSHKWDMKKSGAGFEIDVEKLSSQEQDDLLKYLHSQDFLEESVNEAARVPSNVLEFAKRKGSYATALVKKAAGWAEKAGKYISNGTAIGKNYSTIILDMKHHGSEIYIDLDDETIELFGEPVTDAKSFAKVLATNESVEVNEAEKIEVGIFVRYKKDKDFTGGKIKSIKGSNAEIHNWDGSTTELPLKDLEYVKSWNESINKSINEAVSPEVHRMVNKFVKSMADKFDYPLQDAVYAILDVLKSQNYKGLKESAILEFHNTGGNYHTLVFYKGENKAMIFSSKNTEEYGPNKGGYITSEKYTNLTGKEVKNMLPEFMKEFGLRKQADLVKEVMAGKLVLESVNEAETLIFDEIGENLFKLQDQIDSMLKWKITDQKWIVALKGIQSACSKLEDTVAKADQKLGALGYNESLSEGTLKLDEGAVKQFEIDYKDMESSIKRGIGWIDPEYVAETWENSSDTIDYEIVRNEILTRLIKADLLYTSRDGETKGKRITNISQIK